jgi:hypothetical protein
MTKRILRRIRGRPDEAHDFDVFETSRLKGGRKMTTRKKAALGTLLALSMAGAGRVEAVVLTPYATLDLQVTFTANLSVKVDGIQGDTATLVGYSAAGTTNGNPGANDYASPSSSATVTNDGGTTEKWQLTVSTLSTDTANWALVTTTGSNHTSGLNGITGNQSCTAGCPGAEQYEFQALFVSSDIVNGAYNTVATGKCPWPGDAAWDVVADTVPGTGSTGLYTSTQYNNVTSYLGSANGNPDFSISGLTGQTHDGDMLPLNNQAPGTGKRALCVRVTMPSTTVTTGVSQDIRLVITAIGG